MARMSDQIGQPVQPGESAAPSARAVVGNAAEPGAAAAAGGENPEVMPDLPTGPVPTGDALLVVRPPEEPYGFADFWRATFAEAMAVPLDLTVEAAPETRAELLPDHHLSILRFTGLGGYRHGAWLAVPRGPMQLAIVNGHGYGGREGPGVPPLDGAMIMTDAPGFNLSSRADVPAECMGHVVHGIELRETYLIRFCVAGIWAAVSALIETCPQVAGRVTYWGGSFGGGLGALAMPWDSRFSRGVLDVPTFGHHPWRLRVPCAGSGEAVRLWHRAHPESLDVLRFYDAAIAAARIRVPMLVAPARRDPVVPPVGQFAVANAIPGAIIHERRCGHLAWSGEAAECARLDAAALAFLRG
jgi:cephalosporin-C deacetylase